MGELGILVVLPDASAALTVYSVGRFVPLEVEVKAHRHRFQETVERPDRTALHSPVATELEEKKAFHSRLRTR